MLALRAPPPARRRVSLCQCNEAKEKSFVLPSDSAAASSSLKLSEQERAGSGRGGRTDD